MKRSWKPEAPAADGQRNEWPDRACSCLQRGRYESQANAQIRESIMDGWADCFGEDNVTAVHISAAASSIRILKPTIVFAIGSYLPESTYFGEVCREAKKIGAVTVFWATEDPYEQDANYRIADDFDVIFSCDRWGIISISVSGSSICRWRQARSCITARSKRIPRRRLTSCSAAWRSRTARTSSATCCLFCGT